MAAPMAGGRVGVEPDRLLLLAGAQAAVADPGLAASLHRFDATWGRVRSELDDDLTRLADALALLAEIYRDAEQRSADRFGWLRHWFGR